MEDRLRSTGFTQWVLILMPVVPVLSLLAQYQALWVVLVAYVLGTYPIFSSVIAQAGRDLWSWHAGRRATEPATVSACMPC